MNLNLHLKKKEPTHKHKHFSWNPVHPRRDWQYLLVAFVILAVLIGVWSGYLFLRSDRPQEVISNHQVVDNGSTLQIERISSFFEKRKPADIASTTPPL